MLSLARVTLIAALALTFGPLQSVPPPTPAQIAWLTKVGAAAPGEIPALLPALPESERRALLESAWRSLDTRDVGTARSRLGVGKGLVRLARAQGDARSVARALYLYGSLAMNAEEWGESESALIESADAFAALGEGKLEGATRLNRTIVLNSEAKFEEATVEGLRAMAILKAAGDWENESMLGSTLSDVYLRLGKTPEALETAQRAREVAVAHNDGELTAMADLALANVYVRMGKIPEALEALGRAATYYENAKDWTNFAICEKNRCVILFGQGRYAEAETAIQIASKAFHEANDPVGIVQTECTFGALRLAMGRYAEAAEISLRVEQDAAKIDPNTAMMAVGNYGSALLEQGLYPEGYEAMQRYRRLAHEQKAGRDEAFGQAGVGSALAGLGRRDAAIAAYQEAIVKLEANQNEDYAKTLRTNLDVLRAIRNDPQAPTYLYGINRALRELAADPKAALRDAEAFLASPESKGNDALQSVGLYTKGRALRRLGRGPESLEALGRALDGFVDQRSRVNDPLFATYAMSSAEGIVGELVEAGARFAPPERLLRSVERANGAAVRRSLLGSNVLTKGLSSDESDRLLRLFQTYQESMKDADRGKLLGYEASLRVAHPRWAGLEAAPVEPAAIAAALGTGSLGVEYVASERSIFALCLTQEEGKPRATLVRLPTTPQALRADAEALRRMILAGKGREDSGYRAIARRLYDVVIAPPLRRLPKGTSLVVSTWGPLSGLPLTATLDPQGRYLIEGRTLVEVPSLSAWQACRVRARAVDALPPRPPLLVAISRFGGRSKPGLSKTSGGLPAALPDLPHVPQEAATVRRWAPGANFLSEAGASRERVLAAMPAASAMHFATHAISDDRAPLLGAVVLASRKGKPSYLMARELTFMVLDARFAFLSACATASGTGSRDGALGLSWAFMVAGVPTVVASRWNVDDAAVAPWTEAFYGGLGKGVGLAASAQRASIALIRRKDRSSKPIAWAAWSVFGSG